MNDFLIEKIDTLWRNESVFCGLYKCRSNKFYKIDVDNNGLTDLIIDAKYSFIVLDKGGNKYDWFFVDKSDFEPRYKFLKSIKIAQGTLLLFTDSIEVRRDRILEYEKIGKVDTIVYKESGLFEYCPDKLKYKINKISFKTSGCFGTCPIFNIEIHEDGNSFFQAKEYNLRSGNYIGTLDDSLLYLINNTINELNIEKLSNNYSVNWTDDETGELEIWYNNGKHKKVSDYGMQGTVGLGSVYDMFLKLRDLNLWKPWSINSLNDSAYFSFAHLFEGPREWYNNNDVFAGYTYVDTESGIWSKPKQSQTFSLRHGNVFVQINSNHTYVFGESYNGHNNFVSVGEWKTKNDSTIELNWDRTSTTIAARDSLFCKKYLSGGGMPQPMQMENWNFVYLSKNRKILKGLGKKKDEK